MKEQTQALDLGFYAKYYTRHSAEDRSKSHWTISDEELIGTWRENWENRKKSGAGWMVPLSPEGFFTPFAKLVDGDEMYGQIGPRDEGETDRMSTFVHRPGEGKSPAKFANLIVYDRSEIGDDAKHELNGLFVGASLVEDEPFGVSTLLHNVLALSGGSPPTNKDGTPWSLEKTRSEISRSIAFERAYARLAPDNLDGLIPLGKWSEGKLWMHDSLHAQVTESLADLVESATVVPSA